jgi:crotonobetaine/carnitine-CoA ligase
MLDREVLLPNLIGRFAREEPDRPFITEVTGRSVTYGEFHRLTLCWVHKLRELGLSPGDRALTMSPPRIEWLAAWMGLAMIKAVDAGVSTDFHGDMLRYVVHKARARVMIVAPEYVERLTDEVVEGSELRTVVVTGMSAPAPAAGVTTIEITELPGPPADPASLEPVEVWDTAAMILTSGTTGPSKYVVTPWGTHYTGALSMVPPEDARPDDVSYVPLPIYHLASRFSIYAMALVGGQLIFRDQFSRTAFWLDVRRYGCTVTNVAPFARLLIDEPARLDDADNPLRTVMIAPRTLAEAFSTRFRVQACSAFGTSEMGVPIAAGFDAGATTCGKPRAGYPGLEARIVDQHDQPVPAGHVGELIVRSSEPWAMFKGYFDDPEATARAWCNGWLHTGDAFKQDEDGNLYFVDRIKDALRRRGQNISSFEVEAMVNRHPGVAESAAVGIPVEGEEDELLIVVVPADQGQPVLDHAELYRYLVEKLPRSMLPRYLRVVRELPKTAATARVQKARLRAEAVTVDTWDSESTDLKPTRSASTAAPVATGAG